MGLETVTFKVAMESFDAEAAKQIRTARENLRRMENELVKRFRDSDRFKAASDLSGTYDGGGKRSVIPRLNGDYIEADILVDVVDPVRVAQPSFSMSEKTVNLLLSGKLLTDDQKKALIKRMGFDLDTLNDASA